MGLILAQVDVPLWVELIFWALETPTPKALVSSIGYRRFQVTTLNETIIMLVVLALI